MSAGKIFKGYSSVNTGVISDTKLYDIDLIKQDLLNHFSIKRGEKLENPDFGTIIPWLLFEPFTEEIEKSIEEDVVKIFNYDPRVRLNVVEVIRNEDQHAIVVVCDVTFVPFDAQDSIAWEFREDGTIQMLGY